MDTLAKINGIIQTVTRDLPGPDEPLLWTHRIDSMDLVDITVAMEKQFGISVAGEEVNEENFNSVRQMAVFIDRKRGAGRGAGQ